jgi:kumamolisin
LNPLSRARRRHARSRPARRRQVLVTAAIGTAGSLLLLGAGPAGAATHSSRPGRVQVAQGIGAAALNGAHDVGPAAAGDTEQVSFILKATHPAALHARVGSRAPALSVRQFAAGFGQPAAQIAPLVAFLKANGIRATVDANHLDVQTSGTVADYNQALGITQSDFQQAAVPARGEQAGRPAVVFHGTTQPTTLPAAVAPIVLSILGLTDYPTGFSNAVHTPRLAGHLKPAAVQTGSRTPASFASQYGLTPLLKAGRTGQGQTIGIVTLASLNPSDPTHFWSSVLKIRTRPGRISLDNVDGGAGAVSEKNGSDETTLDVEQSGAIAPSAGIVVYQAPNTDAGFIDAFAAAASQNRAGVVSTSWGESETFVAASVAQQKETASYAQAFDEMFLELAAQGQSTFAAAGDSGAYDASADLGTTDISVDEPASSPWITAAGGTTLPGKIEVAQGISAVVGHQRAWGWDWLWPLWQQLGAPSEDAFVLADNVAGGGGGYSAVEPRPGYQSRYLNVGPYNAVEYLTPDTLTSTTGLSLPSTWDFNPAPTVTGDTGTGRAVPDLSADADPFTGYVEYFKGFTGNPLEAGWGGTSFVAPQLAGAAAVINSYVGHRTGFWNPALYRFAAGKGSPFTPLASVGTGNDNLFFTGRKGDRYNPATGLGVPNLAVLAARFKG